MPPFAKSDHCDGTGFYNPTKPEIGGLWAGLKILAGGYEKWPAKVENAPALDLDHALNADEIAVTFVNHATVLVQTQGFNFLTDPVWSERVSPLTWIGPKRHRAPGVAFDLLPKIDLVVVSHNHYDHMDVVTLKQLNNIFHPVFIVPLGNKRFLESKGIENVTELDWWQNIDVNPAVRVTATPAEHFSGRGLGDRNKTLWASFVISIGGHSVYFGGDTAYSPHFKAIRDRLGSPDIAFLPIGAYEPRWFMKPVHMNPEEAVQAHVDLGSVQSVGIHFGTFQLTSERIDQPIIDLATSLKSRNLAAEKFLTLGEGRTQIFDLKK